MVHDATSDGPDGVSPLGVIARVAVFLVVVVGLVVLAGVFGAVVSPSGTTDVVADDPGPPTAYDPAEVGLTAGPEVGTPDPDPAAIVPDEGVDTRTVVIDAGHRNRIDRGKLRPVVEALSRVGHNVRFYEPTDDLDDRLADADGFLVVDPATDYSDAELDAVRNFTDRGGRMVLLAEPTRRRVSAGLTGVTVSDVDSDVTELAAAYGMNFDTAYVYNQRANDAGYKDVLVETTDAAGFDTDDAAFFTATRISATGPDTEVIARTAPKTNVAGRDTTGAFAVGVRNDSVLAFADSTFVDNDFAAVRENEVVVTRVVEFLAAGVNRSVPAPTTTPAPGGNATDAENVTTTEEDPATTTTENVTTTEEDPATTTTEDGTTAGRVVTEPRGETNARPWTPPVLAVVGLCLGVLARTNG